MALFIDFHTQKKEVISSFLFLSFLFFSLHFLSYNIVCEGITYVMGLVLGGFGRYCCHQSHGLAHHSPFLCHCCRSNKINLHYNHSLSVCIKTSTRTLRRRRCCYASLFDASSVFHFTNIMIILLNGLWELMHFQFSDIYIHFCIQQHKQRQQPAHHNDNVEIEQERWTGTYTPNGHKNNVYLQLPSISLDNNNGQHIILCRT
jgi:hypothetical protein